MSEEGFANAVCRCGRAFIIRYTLTGEPVIIDLAFPAWGGLRYCRDCGQRLAESVTVAEKPKGAK